MVDRFELVLFKMQTDFQPLKIPAIRPTVMLPANGVDKSYKPIVLLPDVVP